MNKFTDLPLIDHRIYTIAPRKMGEFLKLFEGVMPALIETMGNPIGFYTSFVGQQNQFVHLWAYASLADYEERCKKRDSHPAMASYMAASGPLIVSQETRLIRRADLLLPFVAG